jgi:hypothetical protein
MGGGFFVVRVFVWLFEQGSCRCFLELAQLVEYERDKNTTTLPIAFPIGRLAGSLQDFRPRFAIPPHRLEKRADRVT